MASVNIHRICLAAMRSAGASLLILMLSASPLAAQTPATATPVIPDWALPAAPDHIQTPPPAGFHRPSRTFNEPIGIFDGQSDIGSALTPGRASYDPATRQYRVTSAGYNIWYFRDEFQYLWKTMPGDVSLAADVSFADPNGFHDRKLVLVIRQNLDDDSKEAMVGEHGTGMVHLAYRPEKHAFVEELYRTLGQSGDPHPQRLGIEKRGDSIAIFMSETGEPMHQIGPPLTLHFDAPFYVGVGFLSHQPARLDTAVFSNVVLKNSAGEVH